MQNKIFEDAYTATSDISDGATVLISGFSGAGVPETLISALLEHNVNNLTIVHNNAGNAHLGIARLLEAGRVKKIICSFPRSWESHIFEKLYYANQIELECVPQGTLAERLRAAGAGIGAFYTPTGYNTEFGKNKEKKIINGCGHILEYALPGDYAFIKAKTADTWGNLQYRMAARNFGPVMSTAGRITIAEVDDVVPAGHLDPETIVTSGVFVQRVVNPRSKL